MRVIRITSGEKKSNKRWFFWSDMDRSNPHPTEQVGQRFCQAVVTHVKADQGQVSAICVQVVETLLLEVAV